MIRARTGINKQQNNSNNYNNAQQNMLHQRFAQTSEDSITSGSLTASTASLLAHQQHEPLSPAMMQSTAAASAAANAQRSLHGEQLHPAAAYQARHTHYPAPFAASKWNYLKLQFPGAATAASADNDDVDTVRRARDSSPPQASALHDEENKLRQLLGAKAQRFIRRIRRPRDLPPPIRTDNTADAHTKEPKASVIDKGKAFITEFLQDSSIHGFPYLAKFGLSIVERTLWFAFICVALFSIISLSKRTWERFQTSPTVISMDRNKLVWNTSFPSLTVCPHKRIDELKVDEYMDTHPEQFSSEEDRADFRVFIEKLADLTYENVETLPRNKTFGITSDKYLDLLYELKWNFEPEMSSGAAVQMYIYETLTEFGICHSVNSLVARYNSYDYWKNNDWGLLDHGDQVTVHPLDGEIYAQIINLSTAYDVYFHGAGDIPNISKQRYTFPESDYTTVELIALEIYTTKEARSFTTKQRKCRFQHEAEEMLTAPIYSFGLCLAECRMFFALKICGCVPHFYRNHLKNGRVLPVCGFDGFECLENIKREIISLKSNRFQIDCNCLSNCDDSNFFVQSHRSRIWFLGANLQWGIIDYPKMQLRRDVLFSFADVLVYIGGLVGFFLGCSALSFTEVVYYFTARFIRRMFCN